MKYHYFHRFFTYSVGRNACTVIYRCGCHGVLEPSVQSGVKRPALFRGRRSSDRRFMLPRDPIRGHCQAGSSTGAVHLSKNNAGVLRPAQRGQKPRVEQKGKSWLDPDVQYA